MSNFMAGIADQMTEDMQLYRQRLKMVS